MGKERDRSGLLLTLAIGVFLLFLLVGGGGLVLTRFYAMRSSAEKEHALEVARMKEMRTLVELRAREEGIRVELALQEEIDRLLDPGPAETAQRQEASLLAHDWPIEEPLALRHAELRPPYARMDFEDAAAKSLTIERIEAGSVAYRLVLGQDAGLTIAPGSRESQALFGILCRWKPQSGRIAADVRDALRTIADIALDLRTE